MHTLAELPPAGTDAFWDALYAQAQALVAGESDLVANAANLSALLFHALPRVNWVGFYFMRDGGLVVGPFQGKPACVRIPLGKGVCGTAAAERRTLVVDDVDAFPGHIACDTASRSEIVVPLLEGGRVFGVLDVDSPEPRRFGEGDQAGLERIAALLRPAPAVEAAVGNRSRVIERFTVRVGESLRVYRVEEVDWIQADDYYVKLHIAGETYMVRQTMSALEEMLPGRLFVRIHRSTIVNIDRVKALEPLFQGDFSVVLHDGTELRMSRRRRESLGDILPNFS